ncbi:PHP domain-containing protein [Salinisphaera orenii]|uniref:PHP domain-containing protein n=1 Tax=Salinisphaera orenii TaxID=856731 RepID=UPI000DBE0BF8
MQDLHSHSSRSDGRLSPTELVARAAEQGVDTLALTDHDTVDGIAEAAAAAYNHGIALVAGVEISVTWQRQTLHIAGLGIDPDEPTLNDGLADLQHTRKQRAATIGSKLESLGVVGAAERARELAGTGQIGRAHFARVLVEAGFCKNFQQAFKHYLKPGRNAHVPVEWAALPAAIEWIHAAGGLAVLAHPMAYGFSNNVRRRALAALAENGGDGVEVATGTTPPDSVARVASEAGEYSLYASAGSDFHSPEQSWLELGRLPTLPNNVTPIWQAPAFRSLTS